MAQAQQSLIGARALPLTGIGDGLHSLTAGLNLYLQTSPTQANVLLIVSSAIIDEGPADESAPSP